MSSNSPTDFESSPSLPKEFMLLCMLHNIGATSTERSLTLEQILEWTKMEASDLRPGLKRLNEMGYVQLVKEETVDKFHVTLNGIRKVLSIYS